MNRRNAHLGHIRVTDGHHSRRRELISVLLLALALGACRGTSTASTAHSTSAPAASHTPDSSNAPTVSDAPAASSIGAGVHLFPAPTGPFAVGVRDLDLFDDGAMNQAWYPAAPRTGTGAPEYADSIAASTVWSRTSATMATIVVQAEVDAAPLPGAAPLPVVIAVPYDIHVGSAWRLTLQELASHGFLAVLVEPHAHPGPDATAEDVEIDLDRLGQVLDVLGAEPSLAAQIGHADMERIAVGGHSAGGSLAFELALTDDRVDAVFDLDGALLRQAAAEPVSVPALMVLTELGFGSHKDFGPETFTVLAKTPQLVTIGILGADHLDIVDFPLISELLGEPLPGGPAGGVATTSTAEIVERFLRGALVDGTVPEARALADGVPAATATADFLS